MSVAPYAGVVALDNFKSPTASEDGLQGQVPKPLAGQQTYILSASGWVAAGSGDIGTVTSVDATVPAFLSVSGVPITTSGTIAITYSGTALPVANGGTGVTASTGANSVVLRDANQNVTANTFDGAYINTAASGTQITLTVASARRYTITGSGGQVIKLPDATTLVNGTIFEFDNNQSSGAITVNNNSDTLVVSVPSGGIVRVNLLSNATAAGSWDRHDLTPSNVSWSTNTLDYAGSITSATWNGNVIALNRGGTGQSTKAAGFNALSPMSAAGDVIYGGTSGAGTALAIGTAGQVLTVNAGATAPVWAAPATSGTVTSVSGTGTVNGISLSGTVTSSGSLTLGGTLDLSSPPAIGGTTPAAGSFTTLTASSTTAFGANGSNNPTFKSAAGTGGTTTTFPWISTFHNSSSAVLSASNTSGNSTLVLTSQGSSATVDIFTNLNTDRQFRVSPTASAVNYVQVTGGTAGNPPVISAQGATTPDLDITLTPKGAGRVNITTSIKPKVNSAAGGSSTTLAWNSTSYDEYALTGITATSLTVNLDSNASPAEGQKMMFRFTTSGVSCSISFTSSGTNLFRPIGVTTPVVVALGKTAYVGCIYNSTSTPASWDIVAVSIQA